MVMVSHQRVCIDGPAASSGGLLECPQKRLPVFIIQIDGVSAVAFTLYVVNRSGVLYSQRTAHNSGSVPDGGKNSSLLLFLT